MSERLRPTLPAPVALGRDSLSRARARERLMRTLWNTHGDRRLPSERALTAALRGCDRRDVFWVTEMCSAGPVYLLPTREWVRALAREIVDLGVSSVLEVGAGDGFLARSLRAALPRRVRLVATDSGAWEEPARRMSAAERTELARVAVPGLQLGTNVVRLDALKAVRQYASELVLVSWPPPGPLLERLIRAPVRYVLEIGATGDTCGLGARSWRFAHEVLPGPIETRALCRLDARPARERHTRVTLYYGHAHEAHHEQR